MHILYGYSIISFLLSTRYLSVTLALMIKRKIYTIHYLYTIKLRKMANMVSINNFYWYHLELKEKTFNLIGFEAIKKYRI